MYGLVNIAIRDFVLREHGDELWERVRTLAGVPSSTFVGMERYPDSTTYDLVAAASRELDAPVETLLELFGEFWMEFTAREGYGDALEFAGSGFVDFLANLDDMHAHIALSFPHLDPPSFELDDGDPDALVLHYRSDRPGLAPMVVGLIRGLAKRFDETVAVEHVPGGAAGESHDTFTIRREARLGSDAA